MTHTEMIKKLEDYKALQRLIEEAEAELEAMKDEIKEAMNGEEVIIAGNYKVTYKSVASTRVDTAALKKALPEVAEKFSKTTTTKRFTVA